MNIKIEEEKTTIDIIEAIYIELLLVNFYHSCFLQANSDC